MQSFEAVFAISKWNEEIGRDFKQQWTLLRRSGSEKRRCMLTESEGEGLEGKLRQLRKEISEKASKGRSKARRTRPIPVAVSPHFSFLILQTDGFYPYARFHRLQIPICCICVLVNQITTCFAPPLIHFLPCLPPFVLINVYYSLPAFVNWKLLFFYIGYPKNYNMHPWLM